MLFLAKQTGPDILFGVNILPRFMEKPTEAYMSAVMRLLRYLPGSSNLKQPIANKITIFCWEKVMQTGVAIKTIAS